MSTLFFEGFNQGTTLNSLDPAYWSTQYSQFPKYGFVSINGFDDDTGANLSCTSPFGSNFFPPAGGDNNWSLFSSTDKSYLCLYNPDYNDGTIEPPTFIRCSGFSMPSGDKIYFSLKVYGLENSSSLNSEYPYRNKFLSFCSGNNEVLNFNMVRITGNFLPQLNGNRETLGIEAIYNDNSIGVFDLNIDGIQNYNLANRQSTHNLMSIIRSIDDTGAYASVATKRYIHLEFLMDQSVNNSGIFSLKVEGIDSPIINSDNNISKTDWSNQMSGSGSCYFDNFKIYNRMAYNNYSNNTENNRASYDPNNKWIFLDDIVLIDNTGNIPTSWLGPSSKIISYKPDYAAGSGLFQWTPNTTAGNIIQKTSDALYSNDGDIGYIQTIDSGNVSALHFSKFTNLSSLPDGIGGIKVYNIARKESLDSQFINVFATGISNLNSILVYDTLILNEFGKDKNDDDTLIDKSIYARPIVNSGCLASRDIIKNGNSSIYFPDNNTFLSFNHPFFNDNPFTLETWFSGNIDNSFTLLCGTNKNSTVDTSTEWSYSDRPKCFQFILNSDSIDIQQLYNTRYYDNVYGAFANKIKMSGVKLYAPNSALNSNSWNHFALCRNNDGSIVGYFNGQANTSYRTIGYDKTYTDSISYTQYSGPIVNSTFNMYTFTSPFSTTLNNFGTGDSNQNHNPISISGLFIGQASGYLDNYRISLGKSIYSSNFTPPSSIFLPTDYFNTVGPVHNVTQSSYKTFQYYSFSNPVTNKNWKVSEISGMAFGVKKL